MIGARIDKLDPFKQWLSANGAELVVPIQQHEVIRFNWGNVVGIAMHSPSDTKRIYAVNKGMRIAYLGYKQSRRPSFAPKLKKRQQTTPNKIATLIERDGRECFYCGGGFPHTDHEGNDPLRMTVDHVFERSNGGTSHIANLVLAHQFCNEAVANMSVSEKFRYRDEHYKKKGRTDDG